MKMNDHDLGLSNTYIFFNIILLKDINFILNGLINWVLKMQHIN